MQSPSSTGAPDADAVTSAPIVDIAGLGYRYGEQPVLDGLNLTLQKGEHALLLGPSGSGKTTLINLLCGLLTPHEGDITVCGESLSRASNDDRDAIRRRHIGLVFQQIRLVSALDLKANLRLAQKLAGRAPDEDAIDELIAEVGLAHRAHAKPRMLSQGEMQRGGVARALIAAPALLIADEPTSALDDENAERVAQLFIRAAERNGSTLLIATHDARLKAHIPNAVMLKKTGGVH